MKARSLSLPVRPGGLHAAIIAVVGCGLVLSVLQRGLLFAITDGQPRMPQIIGVDVSLWLLWLPLCPVIVIAARRWTFRSAPVTDLVAHLGAAATLVVIHTAVFRALQFVFTGGLGGKPFLISIAGLLTWRLAIDASLYAMVLAITRAWDAANPKPASPASAKWHRNPNRPIAVVDGTRTIVFEQHEVSLVEAADYYAKIHARGRVWLIRESLDALEARLASPPFFRTHRSAIVNVRFVTDLLRVSRHRHEAVLRDGVRVSVSAERRGKLEELLVGVSERS